MNYKKIYFDIINKAKIEDENGKRSLGYFEKHHILPKSLCGSNDKENLVKLTAKEHFIVHALLIRFLKDDDLNKMQWAFHKLCSCSNKSNNKEKYVNSRLYENFKNNFQKGINNSQYGTHWFINTKTNEIKKFRELPSDEWILGRTLNKKKERIKKYSLTIEEFNKREQLILLSKIDKTKFGWVMKVSNETGLTRRQINYMVNHSEKLKKICYRR